MAKYESDALTVIFAALADPTRRAILDRLCLGEATVNELAAPFGLSLPTISKHLKVLEHAGLISRARKAQWRPCRIETEPLEQISNWVGHNRAVWSDSLKHLGGYLKKLEAQRKQR